ncbi:glycoside hydrolase family 25 protein [Rugamonas aquatica]|uniref:Lysozyme n=1 Tax=Rugamonas aquatica TaxID=2743357 RepID=A0A6A7N8L3_9BURK|nr:GH25 family lysozyme [Rugamonas aquatica]MQA41393.1 hypothetical protein [Rugamonas aquatica]
MNTPASRPLFAFMLLGSVHCLAQSQEPAPVVSGIDISHHQGTFDFSDIAGTGHRFVFVKASEGMSMHDSHYLKNIANARKAGLAVGSYHYYDTDAAAADQLENFEKIVVVRPGDLPPIVDIEKMSQESLPHMRAELQVFLNALEAKYGARPIIYSGRSFAGDHLREFGRYNLWLAEYGVSKPTLPAGWSEWRFWQYSQDCRVGTFPRALDCNVFNGTLEQFKGLLVRRPRLHIANPASKCP